MIWKLKLKCGAQFTSKMQGMLNDLSTGKDHTENFQTFAKNLDAAMETQNVYYKDLIQGNVLRCLVITPVVRNGFQAYMKSIGKLGGQNKVPRLSNDRKIADALINLNSNGKQ